MKPSIERIIPDEVVFLKKEPAWKTLRTQIMVLIAVRLMLLAGMMPETLRKDSAWYRTNEQWFHTIAFYEWPGAYVAQVCVYPGYKTHLPFAVSITNKPWQWIQVQFPRKQ